MPSDLQRILEEIRSSDVVEARVQLLTQLGHLDLAEKSDVLSLVECLATLWEDFTCLDVSQCMLNKSILHVTSKYLDSNLLGCFLEFLALGTKTSQWCSKHLKMSLMSTEESQDEKHCRIFFQLLLDCFHFSASSFAVMKKFSVMYDNASAVTVHSFVLEQLNLTKEVISNAEKIDSFSSEILKAAQVVIDSVVHFCKEYSQAVNWDISDTVLEENKENKRCEDNIMNHFLNITASTVETLSGIGVLAARNGGSLVTILNTSWKGVIVLLQLGKQNLVSKLKTADIILKLILLINESLRFTAESWSSFVKDSISSTEARRAFLPVKFYLINAVKVALLFPSQAYVVYKEITLCILMISTFRFSLSQEKQFKTASEVMTDLLEKLSVDLLWSLLNSNEVKYELKHELLDWLFIDDKGFANPTSKDQSSASRTTSLLDIFSVRVESVTGTRILLLGRVALFHYVMKYSLDLEEDVKLAITTKLPWFLDILIDEEVYSSVLAFQLPSIDGSGKTIIWEPIFSALVLSLKTFMIVVSSSPAWAGFENFLLENFLHSHFLCWEIVMELWCFLTRHAEVDLLNDIIEKLCAAMKSLASSESVLIPDSALRKMARSVCLLLNHGTKSLVDQVYVSVVGEGRTQLCGNVYVALLLEGFPLNTLSDSMRNNAKQQIIADYFNFIESFDGNTSSASRFGLFGAPVFALSACLQILQVSVSDIDAKTLKFLITLIHSYRNPDDKAVKDLYRNLLSETLAIISHIDQLYISNEMDGVISELQKLFVSDQPPSEPDQLNKCKPNLALFMAGLSHMEMSENDTCSKSCAVWELYHMLLKERHWALVHLAVTAFGYFCARTTCNQLWRFVPHNAALAFDTLWGNEANTERFMSALKVFLEKDQALLTITPCSEQLGLLVKEGRVLKELVQKLPEACERMEVDEEDQSNKRRKLPEEIHNGVELLKDGLKAISEGLSQWQMNQTECDELHDKILSHFSCLEDVVSNIVGLAHIG